MEKEKAYAETRARIFSDGSGKGQSSNAGAPKAVYRNREQEESDPDFRRGSPHLALSPQPPMQQSRLQAAAPAFVPKSMAGEDQGVVDPTTTPTSMG